jgi:toxin ParE1/3/4
MACKFLSRARQDLREIARYIGRRNPVRAISYVKEIERRCHKLAAYPLTGRLRPELAENLRSTPFGSYVVFYSIHTDDIHIEHILHGARDAEKIFEQ